MQWAYSHCFPAKVLCAHVTNWNSSTSVKFRVDVASMCKLGFDIGLKRMSENDRQYCRQAIANFNRVKTIILDGDQYRLVSPLETDHMSLMYVSPEQDKAVLFAYNINPRFGEALHPVQLQGLDANRQYRVREINLPVGQQSRRDFNDRLYSGDYLMKVGLNVLSTSRFSSTVVEITAE